MVTETQRMVQRTRAAAAEKAGEAVRTGAAAAAMVACGIGGLVLGLMTTGAVISEGLKSALNWWNPAGPLTGKTGVAILAWVVSWILLNARWKEEDRDLSGAFRLTLILLAIGLILSFPPVFEAFE